MSVVRNSVLPRTFWVDGGENISLKCDVVGIRPYVHYLVNLDINGLSPFDDFDDFLSATKRYDFHAKYHKACLSAYFDGDLLSLDKQCVRAKLIDYIQYLDVETGDVAPYRRYRNELGLPQLCQQRPESAMDVYCFYRHCGFQCQPKTLRNFGESLEIPLYAEIKAIGDDAEFLEQEQGEVNERRTRVWSTIPKRLTDGVQTVNVQLKNGKELQVARIGDGQGEMRPEFCFWLNGKSDSVHLFEDSEINNFTSPLTRSQMSRIRDFGKKLAPSYDSCAEDIELMEEVLYTLKLGNCERSHDATRSENGSYEYDDFLIPFQFEASLPTMCQTPRLSDTAAAAAIACDNDISIKESMDANVRLGSNSANHRNSLVVGLDSSSLYGASETNTASVPIAMGALKSINTFGTALVEATAADPSAALSSIAANALHAGIPSKAASVDLNNDTNSDEQQMLLTKAIKSIIVESGHDLSIASEAAVGGTEGEASVRCIDENATEIESVDTNIDTVPAKPRNSLITDPGASNSHMAAAVNVDIAPEGIKVQKSIDGVASGHELSMEATLQRNLHIIRSLRFDLSDRIDESELSPVVAGMADPQNSLESSFDSETSILWEISQVNVEKFADAEKPNSAVADKALVHVAFEYGSGNEFRVPAVDENDEVAVHREFLVPRKLQFDSSETLTVNVAKEPISTEEQHSLIESDFGHNVNATLDAEVTASCEKGAMDGPNLSSRDVSSDSVVDINNEERATAHTMINIDALSVSTVQRCMYRRTRRVRVQTKRLQYFRRSYEKFLQEENKKRMIWSRSKTRRYSAIRHK